MKGTYIIVIHLLENSKIKIGSLGILDFIKGYYLYIGSAMGNKGSTTLENRIKRHLSVSNNKNLFWHVDYLLASKFCLITEIYLISTIIRLECIISKEVYKASDNYIKNFGSSDCQCTSHLYYFKEFRGIKDCIN
ncbi:MAG: GIY-YIG nuclease family protein [Candidatus Lokiarchaeota archaeon]|nr:GIY-YIG nuclease family protein [Candidatus Lokiarchaeota archaeon]